MTASEKQRYREQMKKESLQGLRLAVLLAGSLFPVGTLLDWYTARAYFVPLSIVRWSTALVSAIIYFLIHKRLIHNAFPWLYFFIVVCAGSITGMCVILGGYESSYYAGINLVILGSSMVFPWTFRQGLVVIGMSLTTYMVPVLVQAGFRIDNPEVFINNLFFLSVTGAIALAARHMHNQIKLESFRRLLTVEEGHRKLQQYDQLKSEFFSNVSHELRTPLTLILGCTNNLLRAPRDAEAVRSALDVVSRNAALLLRHVNDLLDVAKLEAKKMSLSARPMDLAVLLRRMASLFETEAKERGISFSLDAPEKLEALLDSEKIERIIVNLISNAFKFGESRPVRCRLRARGDQILLSVEDSGLGIATEVKQRIFERFYQSSGGHSRKFSGTGLGLAISKEFAELHEGSISAENNPLGGAVFTLTLPWIRVTSSEALRPAGAEMDAETIRTFFPERPPAEKPDEYGAETAAEILLVEDNADMRAFITEILTPSYSVITARNGEEALKKIARFRPDLVISDIMMPEMSGDELVAALKSQDTLKSVPIILVTAKASSELKIRLLTMGADDYLVKPFSPAELLARIRNVLSLSRSRELLRQEVASKEGDLEVLAQEVVIQKRNLSGALAAAQIARDQAVTAERVKSDFLAMISHELRTPLTSLSLCLQLFERDMKRSPANPAQVRLLGEMLKSRNRLLALIESMLEYCQIQGGRFPTRIEDIDPFAQIRQVLDDQAIHAQNKGLILRFEPPAQSASFRTDPELFQIVLSNLISNSVKYTEKGSITVIAGLEAGALRLEIQDTGVGIPLEFRQKIFEPFERVPGPTSFQPGVGLGLSLVKKIVDMLGGDIELRSELGQGSVFRVTLPPAPGGDTLASPLRTELDAGPRGPELIRPLEAQG